MAKKTKEDGLDIPGFLKRTEVDRDLVERIIRQDSLQREWVMPDQSKYNKSGEAPMAKQIEINCEDPELPVQVSLTKADGSTETKAFGDMAEFGTFFDAKLHEVELSEAGEKETLICLREKTAKAPKPKATKVEVQEGVQPKTPASPPPAPAAKKKAVVKAKAPEPEPEPVVEKPASKKKAVAKPPPAPVSRGAVIKPAPKAAVKKAAAPKVTPKAKVATKRKTGGKIIRHGCKVNGVQYKSAWEAFQKLKLGGVSECIRFRTILKASKTGKETYEKGGKKYPFIRTEG